MDVSTLDWRKSHTPKAACSPHGDVSVPIRMNVGLKA